MNTIFAQCSGLGKSGVAVYRISGPSSILIMEKLIKSSHEKMQPRSMYFRKIFNPKTGEQIDEAMVVYFIGRASFTGEDSVELHVHGSIAVMKLLNEALIQINGLRLAEPGEFTKRAFLNGKFDLTAAEGLADLIDAETKLQHKQAIRQLGGGLEELYSNWRKQLTSIMALLEAYIDFPDEEIPQDTLINTKKTIDSLCNQISHHLSDNNRGERLRNGLKLAIIGPPNVGKSSLMNYLLKRDISIVSNIPGTTRDVIEGHIDIGGYPIILQDTAGIRIDSNDQIEKIGINKAIEAMDNSDIKIVMYDVANYHELDKKYINDTTILVVNKIDMDQDSQVLLDENLSPIYTSIKTHQNLDQITNKIAKIAATLANPSDNPQITRARHRAQLDQALESLSAFDVNNDLVLAAEDIRMTIRYLSNITGAITVDEILGEIFSNFCIGK